jgi:hypothetical protein
MHYATSWKVAGSVPEDIIRFFFNLPNPKPHYGPGLTQPLIGISTRNIRNVSGEYSAAGA